MPARAVLSARTARARGWRATRSTHKAEPMMIPRLRTTEQLVRAGHDEIRAGRDGFGQRWLWRKPEADVSSSAPLPEILQNRQPMFTGQHDQLGSRYGVDKPEGPEIARVDLQDRRPCLFGRRGSIVAGVGSVRGSDLDQPRPGLAQHFRHSESTADLDGFSARDHDILAGRHRRQNQKHRRGAVVHDQRRLCSGQRAQQPADLAHAAAALVALQVDLQRHRVGCRGAHGRGASPNSPARDRGWCG